MARLATLWRMGLVGAMIALAACSSQDKALEQHQEKLESLGASAAAVAEAWLGGSTSATYTSTAFEQIYQLVEQERSALTSKPAALANNARGAHLSEVAERLSRLLALMTHDVQQRDAPRLRERMRQIPILPQQQS